MVRCLFEELYVDVSFGENEVKHSENQNYYILFYYEIQDRWIPSSDHSVNVRILIILGNFIYLPFKTLLERQKPVALE